MNRQKLESIGVDNPRKLRDLLGCSMSLAYKIWYQQVEISKKQAQLLKQKKGVSLDFLLS